MLSLPVKIKKRANPFRTQTKTGTEQLGLVYIAALKHSLGVNSGATLLSFRYIHLGDICRLAEHRRVYWSVRGKLTVVKMMECLKYSPTAPFR